MSHKRIKPMATMKDSSLPAPLGARQSRGDKRSCGPGSPRQAACDDGNDGRVTQLRRWYSRHKPVCFGAVGWAKLITRPT